MTEIATTELAVVERSLDELAEVANTEYSAYIGSVQAALHHALAAGAAISAIHDQISVWDEYKAWLSEHLAMKWPEAMKCERLFTYRHVLPDEVFESWVDSSGRLRQPSVKHAYLYLRGMPHLRADRAGIAGSAAAGNRIPDAVKNEARRLRSAGTSVSATAALLGISAPTVHKYTTPGWHKANLAKRRRGRTAQAAARKALDRQLAATAARKAAGGVGEIYSQTRKSLQIADRECARPDAAGIRSELTALIRELHVVEDRIGRIIRMSSEDQS